MNLEYIFKLFVFRLLWLKKGLALLFLLFNLSGLSQSKNVLFIGNSYTLRNNLPQIIANIASSRGDELVYTNSSIESYSFQLHSANINTLNSIRQGGWDYVVLQEFSQYPSQPLSWVETNVYPYASFLNNEINSYNSGAETMFYMTWGRRDGDADRCPSLPEVCTYAGMDDLTRERYMFMAQANQAVVSPVGAVWRYIRENYPSIELYEADGSHPSAAGSYAAACCFYTAFFKEDPNLISYNYILNPTVAAQIRTAARNVVYNNMETWYLGESESYTLSAFSGTGGTISPAGTLTVASNSNISFSISPDTGYEIDDIKVDGVSAGAVSNYTFTSVTSNHSISATFKAVIYHTIISSAGIGGSINPVGNVTVSHGSNRTFNINPNYGYQISNVRIDNNPIGKVTSFSFSNVTEDHTISATFETATYSLVATAGNGGLINPSGNAVVTHGTNRSYTITPSTGYQISDVRVDNNSVGSVSSYTFSNITDDHTISATFEILKYTLSGSAGTGGSVSPGGTITADYGSNRTFTFTPNTGYYLSDVIVDDVSVGPGSSYTFRNITDDHTISAVFRLLTFTITGTAGHGGSISPTGESEVDYGSGFTYTITPDVGFLISDVQIDNVSAGNISSYTFSNITSNHYITADFVPITFSIIGSSTTGGSISPSGTIIAVYGTDQIYEITPAIGYEIADVLVDNKSIGLVSSYTFTNITNDHSLSASFSIIKYTITTETNTGGSISPGGKTVVNYGSDLICSISPDYGYRILEVKVDNISIGKVTSYSFSMITDNHNLSVTFEPIPTYTITVSPGTGGSITPSGTVTLFEGSDQTYSIIPNPDYRILNVIIDNFTAGVLQEYTFSNITSDHNISAIFTTSIDVSVYPNPFRDEFKIYIATPEGRLFDMEIANISGKIVLTQTEIPGNTVVPVSLHVSRGYYILRIFSAGKKIATIRIVKS